MLLDNQIIKIDLPSCSKSISVVHWNFTANPNHRLESLTQLKADSEHTAAMVDYDSATGKSYIDDIS